MNLSPFSDDILNLNQAQINWIIEKYRKENPDKLKVENLEKFQELVSLRSWTEVLEGDAKQKWLETRVPKFKKDSSEHGIKG